MSSGECVGQPGFVREGGERASDSSRGGGQRGRGGRRGRRGVGVGGVQRGPIDGTYLLPSNLRL
jgi:hypothetical protein